MTPDDEFLRHINENFGEFGEAPPEELEARRAREQDNLNEKEVRVVGVYEHPRGAFVLLRDTRGRAMPIWIGQAEALSISIGVPPLAAETWCLIPEARTMFTTNR